ncbi:hypothetical protein HGM15179_005287, partial [Zosterops borbonicus]
AIYHRRHFSLLLSMFEWCITVRPFPFWKKSMWLFLSVTFWLRNKEGKVA